MKKKTAFVSPTLLKIGKWKKGKEDRKRKEKEKKVRGETKERREG